MCLRRQSVRILYSLFIIQNNFMPFHCLSKRLILGLLLTLFVVNVRAETQEDAWQLLQKASVAGHVMSYTGIFVYSSKSHTKAVQVKHVYDGKGEYSRNITLEETPREWFVEGQNLTIYNQKKGKVEIKIRQTKKVFPNILPMKTERLKAAYELHAAETDYVAGRSARLLLLIPKDNYRYSYHFWVDQEYGLLLKYELHDDKRELLERITFKEIKLVENLDLDWFRPHIETKKPYEMEKLVPIEPDVAGKKPWQIRHLPVGYKKINQVKVYAHHPENPMTQVVFCDGLSSVSLFIERLSDAIQPVSGHYFNGNTNFFSHTKHGYQITVMGEVPADAVMAFSKAIEFR